MLQTPIANRHLLHALIALCCWSHLCSAQSLQSRLRVPSVLPGQIDEWGSLNERLSLSIENVRDTVFSVKLRVIVRVDSVVVFYTRFEDVSPLNIPKGTHSVLAEALIPEASLQFLATFGPTCARNGSLTPGSYLVHCHILDATNPDRVLATTQPMSFHINGFTAPQLLEPIQFHTVSCAKPVRFSWRGVLPAPESAKGLRYILLLYETPKGMDAQSAIETMQPVLELNSSTDNPLSVLVPANKVRWNTSAQYVWTVRATDLNGHVYGEPDGLAEPSVFRVKK